MKLELNVFVAIFGSLVFYAFGGFTLALNTLLFFMALDYATGILAAYYKRKNISSKIIIFAFYD